jgi:hypothetical protein
MIVEQRKRTRDLKPNATNLASEFNFYKPGDWEKENMFKNDIIPWQIVIAIALVSGASAFAIGRFLI